MIKDIYYIRSYQTKEGEEKSDFVRVGICFGTNKDGSQNFEFNLPMLVRSGMKFQMREREQKEQAPPKEQSADSQELEF